MSAGTAGRRRRTARRKGSGGMLAGLGRWLLCFLLSAVVLLFLASVTGLMGRRAPKEQPTVAADVWAIPSQRMGLATRDEGRPGGLAAKVSQLAEGVREAGRTTDHAEDEAEEPAPGDLPAEVEAQATRVILANGCGVDRLAAQLTPLVRAGGFDVCGVSDGDARNYTETLVIDRSGDRSKAQGVCAYFRERWGVGRVLLQERVPHEADVLVVLGSDLGRQFSTAKP
jgi:hypothetical protein